MTSNTTKIDRQKGVIGFITVVILTILVFNVIVVGVYNNKVENFKNDEVLGAYPSGQVEPYKSEEQLEYMRTISKVVEDFYKARLNRIDNALVTETTTDRTGQRSTYRAEVVRFIANSSNLTSGKYGDLTTANVMVTDSIDDPASVSPVSYRKILVWTLANGNFVDGPTVGGTAQTHFANTRPPTMILLKENPQAGTVFPCTKGATAGGEYSVIPAADPNTGVPTVTPDPYVSCDPTRYYQIVFSGKPLQLEAYTQTLRKLDFISFKLSGYFKGRQGAVPFKDPDINYFRPLSGDCGVVTPSDFPCLDTFTSLSAGSLGQLRQLAGIDSEETVTLWNTPILVSNSPTITYPWTMDIQAELPWLRGGARPTINITAVQQL